MRAVQILEGKDRMRPDDWIRPLNFQRDWDFMADTICTESVYSGTPGDHLRWVPLWLKLGHAWWGSEFGEYRQRMQKFGGFEVIRGKLPAASTMDISKWWSRHPMWAIEHMDEWAKLRNFEMGFGKYNGRTLGLLQNVHPDYLAWLASRRPTSTEYEPAITAAKRLLALGNLQADFNEEQAKWKKHATYPKVFPWGTQNNTNEHHHHPTN